MNSIKEKFDEFISQYPIFEYRVLDTGDIKVQSRVRTICKQECERYGSTWACPPAAGTLDECREKCLSYANAMVFSSKYQRCGGIGYHEHEGDAFHKNGTRSAYREGT